MAVFLKTYHYSPPLLNSGSEGYKTKQKDQRNPVIVFIHGDSYEWGSGNLYDASVLAALGQVVVVTLNYRLGILGFLNANTDGKTRYPSNLGILDQIAALHWVQENIANFGGDPRNVTLMGHGTGASCVHFLMTSEALPEGKLFHRVILMSGSALAPWAVVNDPARATLQVASTLNCTEEQLQARKASRNRGNIGDQTLLGCLRSVPLYQLMRAARPAAMSKNEKAQDRHSLGLTEKSGNSDQNPAISFMDSALSSAQPVRSTWGPSIDGVVVHSFKRRMRDYLGTVHKLRLKSQVTFKRKY